MNAKKEFLEEITGKELVCAKIGIRDGGWGTYNWNILNPGFTEEEFNEFLDKIDFEYDDGYGGQQLFGVILFTDSWSDRGEYDGSEWWRNNKMPTIEEVINYEE